MAHKVIILYRLYMPYYFLGTFTEYPYLYANIADKVYHLFVYVWFSFENFKFGRKKRFLTIFFSFLTIKCNIFLFTFALYQSKN